MVIFPTEESNNGRKSNGRKSNGSILRVVSQRPRQKVRLKVRMGFMTRGMWNGERREREKWRVAFQGAQSEEGDEGDD